MLLLGLRVMAVNRVSGLMLPASTKYLVDNVIGKHQIAAADADCAGGTGGDGDPGADVVHADATAVEVGAAADRGTAAAGAGAHRPAAGSYYDANKTGVLVSRIMSDVEGVRNLDRHRTGGIRRRLLTGALRAGRSAADQRDHDRRSRSACSLCLAGPEAGVRDHSADLPRRGQDQCGSHRAADGIAGRRARGEGISRRGARRGGILRRRAAAAGQRVEDADGDFAHEPCPPRC